MSKLTAQEIEKTKVLRATFEDNKWVVIVTDEDNMVYRVSFDGTESDTNETILSNVHNELLNVDKIVPVFIPQPIVREDLNGLNPIV
jgi:hypothetical protein